MKRGVLYIVWGNYNKRELQRSIDSVTSHGYDYHVAEIKDEGYGLMHKPFMYFESPFDNTLFLDTDTIMMENVDWGFQMCKEWGLCVAHAPASSAYMAGKSIGMDLHPDLPQYNTGVIFFTKNFWNTSLFNDWWEFGIKYPESKTNDQPSFSHILHSKNEEPFYVLNRLWNYRAKMRYEAKANYGSVKILHSR